MELQSINANKKAMEMKTLITTGYTGPKQALKATLGSFNYFRPSAGILNVPFSVSNRAVALDRSIHRSASDLLESTYSRMNAEMIVAS